MLRAPITRSRPALALTAALLLTLFATSCGRSLTSSVNPTRNGRTAPTDDGGATRNGDAIDSQVVVTLAAGTDATTLSTEYQATLIESDADERTASLLPPSGETCATLQSLLATDPRVVTAEPNGWLETAETRQQSFAFDDGLGSAQAVAEQPAAQAIHLGDAHDVALGTGVVVAILDTGIDPQHPQLRTAYAGGWDFVDGDADPTDTRDGIDNDGDGVIDEGFGHGTHVAGIVHLVAPAAKLLAVRVLDSDGRGDILDVAAGVRWAVNHGAKVVNLSLGSLKSSDALQAALEDAERLGVVVISSAGNWGDDTPVEFPARSSHVAAIAAVDAAATPAPFSSFGDIVALAAPGVGVRSAYPGGGYRLWSGTSMSAPFVAGTAALLAEVHPAWALTQMLHRIEQTAGPLRGDADHFGAGALDTGAALAPDRRSHADDEPTPEALRPH
ncbi:MAG TPA: S8 family serine peptidase [Candidatus Eisenbacteria bacterium]|jgi:subtilisin family serine protease